MSFTHADVQNILQLLDASHFDELLLELDGMKLELRRGAARQQPAAAPLSGADAAPARAPAASPSATGATPSNQAPQASSGKSMNTGEGAGAAAQAAVQEIRAPMLGTFYSGPKPGAPAFVSVGDQVEPDTVVGIIEVMKLMNSATAGLRGEVVEVLAKDGELVEYDQPLMRVRVRA